MAATHPKPVREAAKAMYVTGKPQSEIARALGVNPNSIKNWARSYGWKEAREAAQRVIPVSVHLEAVAGRPTLQELDRRARGALAEATAADAERFAAIKREDGEHALAVHERAEPLVRNAAKIFGWEPGTQITIQAAAFAGATDYLEEEKVEEAHAGTSTPSA